MTLRYDPAGLNPEIVGDAGGVSQTDRARLKTRLIEAHQRVRVAHERGELGFIDCPAFNTGELLEWARQKRAQGFREQVIIAIGGSSLGARAIYESMNHRPGSEPAAGLRAHFSENVDPVEFARLFSSLDLERTLFVIITKSGSTVETMAKFWFAWDQMIEAVGEARAAEHFVAITGPKNEGLRKLAEEFELQSFEVPTNIGGRFSVLTSVGLVPLALAGYDITALLDGAQSARECAALAKFEENTLLQASADLFSLYTRGYDQVVMMAYSAQLLPIADWFRQLWAESLGKAEDRAGDQVNVGMTPIKALGVIDQHSQAQLYMEGPQDKILLFLEVTHFAREVLIPERPGLPEALNHLRGKSLGEILSAELRGTRAALAQAGRPSATWRFDAITPYNLGNFIFAWEFITAIFGELLNINAFDQPGVELGKKFAHGLLGRQGFEEWAERAQNSAGAGLGRAIEDRDEP